MNMADSETVMRRYADYSLTSYAECDVIALDMSMDMLTYRNFYGIEPGSAQYKEIAALKERLSRSY